MSNPHTFAYTLTTTQNGTPVRFRYGQKLFLAGNPTSTQNYPADQFQSAILQGLAQWKWATNGVFDFDYWQGSSSEFQTNLHQNGQSSIFFRSQSSEKMDPNVIGYTQVWFNSDNGNILESDIVLNDLDYAFTNDPTHTTSHRLVSFQNKPQVYLPNIITHELGHTLGLSHSANINSSMLYVEFLEQAKLGCDDWAGARHLYPSETQGLGQLTGKIVNSGSEGVAGVVVTAISKQRGIPISSVQTQQDGSFYFAALEAGSVSLQFQSFQGMSGAIPKAVQRNLRTSVCKESQSTHSFPTQFLTDRTGHFLKEIKIEENKTTQTGSLKLKCESISSSNHEIREPRYLLLSPLEVKLEVLDQNQNLLPVKNINPVYQSASGFQIPDSEISGEAYGPIDVKVTATSTPRSFFPAAGLTPDVNPYFVLIFNDTLTEPPSHLPNNARCTPTESFASYISPGGSPQKSDANTTRDGIGFCGNAQAANFHHSPNRTHAQAKIENILSWFIPFLAAIFMQLVLAVRKRRRLNS